MERIVKTYHPSYLHAHNVEPWDHALDDIRSGVIRTGQKIRIWDEESGQYVIGTAEWSGGQPCIDHLLLKR